MEQDINNLIEELTKVNPSNLSKEGLKLFNKINEIIDRNRELEEMLKNRIKYTNELEKDLFENASNYVIPKSLIKETIEKLNKEEQELQDSISDKEREEYSDANIGFQLMNIEIRRNVLKKLLGEEK